MSRGLVRTPAAWLVANAPALFARAPVLDLRVTDLAGHVAAFFDTPWLTRIRWFTLPAEHTPDVPLRRMARCPAVVSGEWGSPPR